MKKLVLLFFAAAALSSGYAQLYVPGGTVSNSGSANVGLNTSAPAHSVDVVVNGTADMRLSNTSYIPARELTLSSNGVQEINATNDFWVRSDYNHVVAAAASGSTNHGILFNVGNIHRGVWNANGDLGVGTLTPITRVHTDGYYTSDPLSGGTGTLMTPAYGMVIANNVGTFSDRIDFTGNSNEYLAGDGTWQPCCASGGTDYDWLHNTSTGDISMGYPNGPYAYGTVTIGAPPGYAAKLTVVHKTDRSYPNGIIAEIFGAVPSGTSVGMDLRNTSTANLVMGFQGGVNGGKISQGGRFWADGSSGLVSDAYGVQCYGIQASNNNYGGYFTGTGGNAAYGVYCRASGSATTPWALYANGNTFTPGGVWTASDRKFKDNIRSMSNISDKLMQLDLKTYTFKTDEFSSINLPSGTQYGLISQELREVFPEFVQSVTQPAEKDEDGNVISEELEFMAVNYGNFIPLLLKAHQEQQAEIDALRAELEALRNAPADAKGTNSGTGGSSAVNRVYQNYPNPFGETTTIKYELADTDAQAELRVYDVQGVLKLSFNDLSSASGLLKIDANRLTPGIYAYVLIVNGKQVDSKQMIITR